MTPTHDERCEISAFSGLCRCEARRLRAERVEAAKLVDRSESPEQIAQRKIHGAVRQILANELKLKGSSLAAQVDEIVRQRIEEKVSEYLTPERMEAALANYIRVSTADVWDKKFSNAVMQRTVVEEIENEFRTEARKFIADNIRIRADVKPEPKRRIIS